MSVDDGPVDWPDRVGYDPVTDTHRAFHTPDDPEPIPVAIVSAVAAVTGTSPMEMEPLYDAVGRDVLDLLLGITERENSTISFRFEGVDVTVSSTGEIVVDETE